MMNIFQNSLSLLVVSLVVLLAAICFLAPPRLRREGLEVKEGDAKEEEDGDAKEEEGGVEHDEEGDAEEEGGAEDDAEGKSKGPATVMITDEWREAFGVDGRQRNLDAFKLGKNKGKGKGKDNSAAIAELRTKVEALEAKTSAMRFYPSEQLTTFSGKVTFENPIGGNEKSFQVPYTRRGAMFIRGVNEDDPDVQVNVGMFSSKTD